MLVGISTTTILWVFQFNKLTQITLLCVVLVILYFHNWISLCLMLKFNLGRRDFLPFPAMFLGYFNSQNSRYYLQYLKYYLYAEFLFTLSCCYWEIIKTMMLSCCFWVFFCLLFHFSCLFNLSDSFDYLTQFNGCVFLMYFSSNYF